MVVRHEKGGKVVAWADVAKDKTKATIKGLKKAKKLWVEVRSVREKGNESYAGILHGAWAE